MGFARAAHGWWIRENKREDIQAFVGKSFKALDHAVALCLNIESCQGKQWLEALSGLADVTSGTVAAEAQRATALALTYQGLILSGLDEKDAAQFSLPFREGMTEGNRARRLHDVKAERGDGHRHGWKWSGCRKTAEHEVHALLLLYASDYDDLCMWQSQVEAALSKRGCRVEICVNLTMMKTAEGGMKEHFGFADGISQPLPLDDYWDENDTRADAYQKQGTTYVEPAFTINEELHLSLSERSYNGIPTGDVLFGRPDSFRELPPSPFLSVDEDTAANLLAHGNAPPGFRDFGFDGSYLVVRQLRQDVAGFWADVWKNAEMLGISADEMAARMMGRTPSGELLRPVVDQQTLADVAQSKAIWQLAKQAGNAILPTQATTSEEHGFALADPYGFGCPLGSHVRRANPRDGGAKNAREIPKRLDSVNNHRILRRGRPYGPEVSGPLDGSDSEERGLLFMCLNTDIARQFEFIQETWLLSRQFQQLGETDPILGPNGRYTMQDRPIRRNVDVQTFVHPIGGEYFFLPGMKAIEYLKARQKEES